MHDGIFHKDEMIDKIILSLNSITISGASNVLRLSNVFQMISALKDGLKDEENAKNKTIELLKEQLKNATEPHIEEGGDVVGGEHYDLDFGGVNSGSN